MKSSTAPGLVLAMTMAACAPSSNEGRAAEAQAALTGDLASFYVVLEGPPAAAFVEPGIDPALPAIAAATRARVAEIETEQAALVPLLEARGAHVEAMLSRLANAIQVRMDPAEVEAIARLPGVAMVERVPVFEPALGSAVPVVGAPEVWMKATPLQGDGITIGIIDSGIDYTHADFGGPGTVDAYAANDPKVIEPDSFPTAKVVGGWDFVGDDYDASQSGSFAKPDPDPLDCVEPESQQIAGGHGTHVAGIAAGMGVTNAGATFDGPYEQSLNLAAFRVAPGVAPRAKLWALKIFGCEGSTSMLGSALDRAADPNQDGVFDDRLDVVNASLGTAYGLGSKTNGQLVTNLTKVGTLMVAAAGNDGQTYFTTSSPGTFPEVLSVAASADNEFIALKVTSPASAVAEYPAAEGGFTTRLVDTGPIAGELVAALPALGCSPLTNAAEIAGKIALVDRGSCSFIQKFENAVDAGAIAAVIVDDEDDPLPFAMGGGDPGSVPIPGVLVRQVDGTAIKAALATGPVTIELDPAHKYVGIGAEMLAGFSSRGPSPVDGRIKPEIAAPGFSIDSARVGSGTEARRSQGTSMASPVVAGAAALVRQAHPTLSPLEVKAALVNTTEPLANLAGDKYGASVVGSGRIAVERAVEQLVTAAADPSTGEIGVSFGAVAADAPAIIERTFVVTNSGASEVTLAASVEPTFELAGAVVTVEPESVVVPAGETATVMLALAFDPVAHGAPGPDPGTPPTQGFQNPVPRHWLNEANGVVRLVPVGGGEDVVVPYHASVRAASRLHGKGPSACTQPKLERGEPVEIALEGVSAHPEAVVSAFQLGVLDEEKSQSATDPAVALSDLRAVGVASDFLTAKRFEEARVFFGVAIAGEWTTPARGPLSVVTIQIDSDQKGQAEWEIRVEPRNPTAGFRDALTANTYHLATGTRVSRVPVNVFPPDELKTYPFNNSVLVFSVLLDDIGLSEESPVFDWTAATERPDTLTSGEKVHGTFDASKPSIDTTSHGRDGTPFFVGGGPVLVDVFPENVTETHPLDLLLLHHTNVKGERWEVVSLAPKQPGNLSLALEAPPEAPAAAETALTLFVTNGAEAAPNVSVAGTVSGGDVVAVETPQGSCAKGPAIDCALGELAPEASIPLKVTVRPSAGATTLSVEASVSSDLECESATDDNGATAALAVSATAGVPQGTKAEGVRIGGGCGCRVGGEGEPARGAWWLLGLVAMAARRRRRA